MDRLRGLRDAHQAWVADRLDESTVDPSQLVYASAIDSAVQLVGLASWPHWTYRMTDPKLSWLEEQLDAAGEFRRRMFVADWPATHPEVEIALLRFSWLLSEAASEFSGRADERQDVGDLHVFRRYKTNYTSEYWRAQREFTAWLARYEGMLFEATKAGNWVREAWRAAGNPAFLVNERLHLVTGPHNDLREHITVLEYEPEERDRLLEAGRERLDAIPALVLERSTA